MPAGPGVLHVATVAAMVAFMVWLFARASARSARAAIVTTIVLAAWLACAAALALAGVTTRTDTLPPGAAAVLGPATIGLIAVLIVSARPSYGAMLAAMPLPALMLAQVFRLPVAIVLHGLALLKLARTRAD